MKSEVREGSPGRVDAAQIKDLRAELGPAVIAKRLGIARSSVLPRIRMK
jgi:hypothetical protein